MNYSTQEQTTPELPDDLRRVTSDMDVSADVVRKYCHGPKVERSLGEVSLTSHYTPTVVRQVTTRLVAEYVAIEAIWSAS